MRTATRRMLALLRYRCVVDGQHGIAATKSNPLEPVVLPACIRAAQFEWRSGNTRCRLHGGLSAGPETVAGRAPIAEAQRRRWWRIFGRCGGQNRAHARHRDTVVIASRLIRSIAVAVALLSTAATFMLACLTSTRANRCFGSSTPSETVLRNNSGRTGHLPQSRPYRKHIK